MNEALKSILEIEKDTKALEDDTANKMEEIEKDLQQKLYDLSEEYNLKSKAEIDRESRKIRDDASKAILEIKNEESSNISEIKNKYHKIRDRLSDEILNELLNRTMRGEENVN